MAIDPITAGFELGGKFLDLLFPDPQKRQEAQVRLIELQQSGQLAQIAVNTEEAKSDNLFVSGWRPFIGWVCGVAFAYHFIVQPLLAFLIANAGGEVKLPAFDIGGLSTVLMGMLGLGGMRSIEKMADKEHLPWQQ